MFDYYQKSFFMNKTVFNNDPIIGLGVFKVEKTKNKKKKLRSNPQFLFKKRIIYVPK